MTIQKHWPRIILKHRDSSLLACAMLCLLGAIMRPSIPIERNIHTYFLIADITQSMNVADMSLAQQPVSRLAYTQRMMHDIIAQLPCHTSVSIGVFSGDAVAALYTPLQVCEHFSAIQDTIDHLDWRMAWSGNSRLRESLLVTAKLLREMPESTKVVYFTDGDEAPLLHAFNTNDLREFQGGEGWFFVGIGSDKGAGIPKLTEDNRTIGYWSNESFAVQPNIAQVTASKSSGRDDSVAVSAYDRYISRRATVYLQKLAQEIGAQYLHGEDTREVLHAIQQQPSSRHESVPFALDWLLATLAAGCLITTCIHRTSVYQLKQRLGRYRKQIQSRRMADRDSVAHDNHF